MQRPRVADVSTREELDVWKYPQKQENMTFAIGKGSRLLLGFCFTKEYRFFGPQTLF